MRGRTSTSRTDVETPLVPCGYVPVDGVRGCLLSPCTPCLSVSCRILTFDLTHSFCSWSLFYHTSAFYSKYSRVCLLSDFDLRFNTFFLFMKSLQPTLILSFRVLSRLPHLPWKLSVSCVVQIGSFSSSYLPSGVNKGTQLYLPPEKF